MIKAWYVPFKGGHSWLGSTYKTYDRTNLRLNNAYQFSWDRVDQQNWSKVVSRPKQHCSSLTFEEKNTDTCLWFVLNYFFNLFGSKIKTRIITFLSNFFTNASMSFFSLSVHLRVPVHHPPSFSSSFLPPVLSIQPEDIFKSILACAFSHRTLLRSRDRDNNGWWNFMST